MVDLALNRDTVILMIMQYLKANLLNESFKMLQQESQISFSFVQSHAEITNAILNGSWETLLTLLKDVAISDKVAAMIYGQIIQEQCSNKEFDLAAYFIKQHAQELIVNDKARYCQLLGIIKSKDISSGNWDVKSQREKLADEICENTTEIDSNTKLMDLIQLGSLREHKIPRSIAEEENHSRQERVKATTEIIKKGADKSPVTPYITTLAKQKHTDEKYHLQVAKFSPDGSTIATGSSDGFIEILDGSTLELRSDLAYQQQKQFMLHEKRILCLDFTSDGKMICVGDESGLIKIWRISDGKTLRKLVRAHNYGVTACKFLAQNAQVISGCYGSLIRIHGLKSASLLKEFTGHTSYITDLVLIDSERTLLSSSADGTIRIWDLLSGSQRSVFSPGNDPDLSINSLTKSPSHPDRFLVCNKSGVLLIVNRKGQLIQRITAEEDMKGDFVAAQYSSDGRWVYAAAQNLNLYVFDPEDGTQIRTFEKIHTKEVIGIAQHPNEARLLTYALDGYLSLWKS